MKLHTFLNTAFIAISLLAAIPSQAQTIRLTTEFYPPYNMVDGDNIITGISTDIVRELFKRNKTSYQIELLPWQRAYDSALSNQNSGVYSTSRTAERERLFKWVSPLTTYKWVFLAKKERNIQLNSLEDAKKYTIGGYYGDATAQYLESKGFTLDLVSRDDLNALKLARDRIDLWATGNLSGPYFAKKQNVTGLVEVLTFKETPMGIAFNPNTSANIINSLNKTLQAMHADGSINTIYEKYR